MAEQMYALVKETAGTGLMLKKVNIPTVGHDDVKIKIHYTSICGTDLHIYNWDKWSQETIKPPMTIGHEFVGEVYEMGSNVQGYKIGDIVSGEGHIVCGHCRNCKAGKRHLCKATKGVGVNRDGAFAEFLVIPQSNVIKCEPGIPEELCSSFDPLGNAVHTALTYNMVGEDVLITGAGPIGIMAAAICRHVGAKHVVITDVNDYRLNLAKEICAVETVNVTNEKLTDMMKKLNIEEGFDIGLEMSGNSSAFNMMIDNMYNGGKIAVLGIQGTETVVPWNKIVWNCLEIKGIYGREMFETWYKMMAMLNSGLNIEKIITHKFAFNDFQKGFDIMNSGKCGKVVLDWRGAAEYKWGVLKR
ncbi:MAG: L-threonine 3-dehydrogenase [Hydrogenoanaerobacterium sp.]